jgi:cysteine desulfuration protein SufE
VVNGLVRLLCEVYNGATPADILASEPTLLENLDLVRDLSPTRRNGLAAVRRRLREIAAQYAPTAP